LKKQRHFVTFPLTFDAHLHRRGVGSVAGEHPVARHRDPLLGDRQPDHDLRKVVPLVFALPVAKKGPFLLVLAVPLESRSRWCRSTGDPLRGSRGWPWRRRPPSGSTRRRNHRNLLLVNQQVAAIRCRSSRDRTA